MRGIRSLVVVVLCLPLTACFEEPVQEHLHLTILPGGPVVATVVQQVAPSERGRDNPQLTGRLEESRASLEQELDPWSQRFARLTPIAEHKSLEISEGEVRRAIRSAVFRSFDHAVQLVEADGLTGNLIDSGSYQELSLFATGGSRATYSQRQQAERLLTEWSTDLADYFSSTIELYVHLDRHPDRAEPCLAHVFDKHEDTEATGPLTTIEGKLVVRVKESMERVAEALLVPDGEAYSLNELSRLVYDPFPARLTIAVESAVLDSVGLIAREGYYERPAVDVWSALIALEGRWVAPDLVTAAAAPAPDDQQPDPDVSLIASLPRQFSGPPTSAEIEMAILSELVPEDVLQLRWHTPAKNEQTPDADFVNWLAVMASAEDNIPD
jgi:hypothetical protein